MTSNHIPHINISSLLILLNSRAKNYLNSNYLTPPN